MQTVITVVCMYCQQFIEDKDGRGVSGVSHGICNVCLPVFSARIVACMSDVQKERAVGSV
jgi:hypothetical protein